MTNCEKIRNAVYHSAGQELSSAEIVSLVLAKYPGTNSTSIIPPDHAGPNPCSGRSYCSCCSTDKQIFNRSEKRGYYVVKNNGAPGEPISPLQPRPSMETTPKTQTILGDDLRYLVTALLKIKPSIQKSTRPEWRRDSALRVIDCVLSLNRKYISFVVPRLESFERHYPKVRTVADLKRKIASFETPSKFVSQCLNYNHDARAKTLANVVDWLSTVSGNGNYDEQALSLKQWAENAKPGDHVGLGISGFGLGGFQYLRMLFGANTTKPDTHIQQFVASCVGHKVSDVKALALMDAAASEAGVSLRDLDTTVWESAAL